MQVALLVGIGLLVSSSQVGCGPEHATEYLTQTAILPPRSAEELRTEVLRVLQARGLTWTVIGQSTLARGDLRPPFDEFYIRVKDFDHRGWMGEARFRFFNDRLMDAWFEPADSSYFGSALAGGEILNCPDDVVCEDIVDGRGQKSRKWTCKPVAEAQQEWIRKYE